MRLRLGCRLRYQVSQPTPMIAMLNVHHSRVADLEQPDVLVTEPAIPLDSYRDGFGNNCLRFVAPTGLLEIGTDTICHDAGELDPEAPQARQHAVQDLPSDTLQFLLGSRYCDTDLLSGIAWTLFENTRPGWTRVQAICDYVHGQLTFDYMSASATRTASQALTVNQGVCRDFAHLAIAFCRCMNIPARYCTGYLSDVGELAPYPPGDFAAWMEVFLDGRWWVFDPRNNKRRRGRVLIAIGRDAADVPLTHSFGTSVLVGFNVWADDLDAGNPAAQYSHAR